MFMTDPHYLRLLAREYPNADAVASEIINLNAILCLPKGTEYFSATCTVNPKRLAIC